MGDNEPTVLGVLVGENPLPAYLSIATLRPHKVWLLHTDASGPPAQRLEHAVRDTLRVPVEYKEVRDDDFGSVTSWGQKLVGHAGSHLDYTGGSKLMAVAATLGFATPQRQWNVVAPSPDETDWRLLSDVGEAQVVDCELPVTLIARLYGRRAESGNLLAEARAGLAQEIARAWCDQAIRTRAKGQRKALDALDKQLEDPAQRRSLDADAAQRVIDGYLTCLGLSRQDETPIAKHQLPGWVTLLRGGWLEVAMRDWIREVDASLDDVRASVVLPRDERQQDRHRPEVDVIFADGHELFVVSCTTNDESRVTEEKAVEAIVRARQVGGMYARVAIVSYVADGARDRIRERLDAFGRDRPQVFGATDVLTWGNGDLSSLERWMRR